MCTNPQYYPDENVYMPCEECYECTGDKEWESFKNSVRYAECMESFCNDNDELPF